MNAAQANASVEQSGLTTEEKLQLQGMLMRREINVNVLIDMNDAKWRAALPTSTVLSISILD